MEHLRQTAAHLASTPLIGDCHHDTWVATDMVGPREPAAHD
jgi:hypothetical protein